MGQQRLPFIDRLAKYFFLSLIVIAISASGALAFVGSPMMIGGTGASLSASPSSITSGASSTLAWSSTGATSCTSPGSLGNTAIPGFTGAASGSVSSGALTTTTTYSVQCGTATASATVTVTGGGGTIACDVGVPYVGTVPAPAQAAGFTTCAANYDFTNAAYTTIGSWFQCPDAGTNPGGAIQWWVWANVISCSNFSMVNDAGVQVLQLKWSASDFNSNVGITAMGSSSKFNYPNPVGLLFPEGGYVEAVYKFTTTPSQCSNYPTTTNCLMNDLWMDYDINHAQSLENDFIEFFGSSGGAGTFHGWPTGGGGPSQNYTGYVVGSYQTIGNRLTINSTQLAVCYLLNGSYLGNPCGTFNYGAPSALNNRQQLIIWDGENCTSTVNCSGLSAPTGNYIVLYQRITVWECAGYKTGPCTGAILTTPP